MKLLMIVIDEGRKEELEVFLSRSGVVGFTEIPRVFGVGVTGPRLGSRAFPRTSAVIFSILSAEALEEIRGGLHELRSAEGDELKMVAWDVEPIT